MTVEDSVEEVTEKLQRAVDKVNWTRICLMKVNEAKREICGLYQQKMSTCTDNYK